MQLLPECSRDIEVMVEMGLSFVPVGEPLACPFFT